MITLEFQHNYQDFRNQLKSFQEENQGKGFLYKLSTPKPVNRIGGVDKTGILYIGQTTKLIDRVSYLYRSFEKKPPQKILFRHGADEIYWQCLNVQEQYPFPNMKVEITAWDNSKEAEESAIREYYKEFGEVPPFNGAIVKRKET